MLADILKQINEAEDEADRIFIHTKTQIIDIEKDALAKIEKINSDTDAAIAKQVKDLTPQPLPMTKPADVTPDDKKMKAAVKYATEEFFAGFKKC